MGRLLAGLLCACAASLYQPARAWQLQGAGSRRVIFLRIQKTGSSTWGEVIMETMCAKTHDTCPLHGAHLDYQLAAAARKTPTDPIVTLLRDPVERTLSEFFFIRNSPEGGIAARQDQWDYQNDTFVRLVRDEPDDDKALDSFLHAWPEQPSFNRQVLYLAGFKRWGAALPFRWTGGEPQQREFLSVAKQHLGDVQAFGFTECFVTSAAAMARVLGWGEATVTQMAARTHHRAQRKTVAAAGLRMHRGTCLALTAGDDQYGGVWRSFVDRRTVEEIERLNWADMELHRFARRQFQERFGRACGGS